MNIRQKIIDSLRKENKKILEENKQLKKQISLFSKTALNKKYKLLEKELEELSDIKQKYKEGILSLQNKRDLLDTQIKEVRNMIREYDKKMKDTASIVM